jgi:hypothetical protein
MKRLFGLISFGLIAFVFYDCTDDTIVGVDPGPM